MDNVIAPQSTLLMKLERQAEEGGGRVHALIGNHEAMNGDHSQLEIRGSYGDLKDIRGHGLAVNRTTLTEASQTYWVEIELDDR